ncbi:TIGR01212 family radical SAM protein [Campylobacterota bacterium]|nr:TIGR01212 family radical SAM protein [Campylobacterota bacterium]
MRVLTTFGRHLRSHFGFSVRKIPLAIPGFTCPNIDGKVGRGGCTYCLNESFSPNLRGAANGVTLEAQIEALRSQYREGAKAFRSQGCRHFIAYFQSFSNTYAPLETLRALHDTALALSGCVGISIATRADCIDDRTLEYLAALEKKTYLWVEIGIQSSNDETLNAINRGETFDSVAAIIGKLKERNLRVCAHLIFGLANDDRQSIMHTVDRVAHLNIDALKIHPLYIVKNTALAQSFIKQEFVPITFETYAELLLEAIAKLPQNIILQRISAGIDSDMLLAPNWCRNKNSFMATIRNRLRQQQIIY